MNKPAVLALFETKKQLDAILEYQSDNGIRIDYVAVTAEADYAAQCAGLVYRTIEEFYDDPKLMEKGVRNSDNVRLFCDRFDRHFASVFSDEKYNVSSHACSFAIKGLLDLVLHRGFVLNSVFNALKPCKVIAFSVEDSSGIKTFDLPHPRESFTSKLVPTAAKYYNCEVIWLKNSSSDTELENSADDLFAQFILSGKETIKKTTYFFKRILKRLNKRPTLIYIGAHEECEAVRSLWRNGVGSLIYLNELVHDSFNLNRKINDARVDKLWNIVRQDKGIKDLFNVDGLELFPSVEDRLHFFTSNIIGELISKRPAIYNSLKRISRGVVLMCGTQGLNRLVADVANDLKIPVVTHHYGGIGYWEWPTMEYLDLSAADYFWCYGEGTAKNLESPSDHIKRDVNVKRAEPVVIGSPHLDLIRSKQNISVNREVNFPTCAERKLKVMYVPGILYGDRRYFGFHMYPDIWYWRLQRAVVKVCGNFQNVHLMLKIQPPSRQPSACNPLVRWIKEHHVENCEIISDKMFVDVMDAADVYLIDAPGTVLLQALTTSKPIIFYADRLWCRFYDSSLELLKKRAMVSCDIEHFLNLITDYFSQNKSGEQIMTNDDFLRKFGTHLNDGKSLQTAIGFLRECANHTDKLAELGVLN